MNVKTRKIFRFNSTLFYHQWHHTGEKPFKCRVRQSVQVQLRVYHPREESPWRGAHECKWCGKCLSSNMVLTQPQMVHSGEKLCVCRECCRAFGRSLSVLPASSQAAHTGEALPVLGGPQSLWLQVTADPHGGETLPVSTLWRGLLSQVASLQHQRAHGEWGNLFFFFLRGRNLMSARCVGKLSRGAGVLFSFRSCTLWRPGRPRVIPRASLQP